MLLMGILPSVIIMVIIFKNAVIKHKPMRKLASVFAISAISVVPAGILEGIGSALMQAFIGGDPRRVYYPDMDSYLIYQLVFYVAVVGIVEEACKFFYIQMDSFPRPQFRQHLRRNNLRRGFGARLCYA